MRDTPSGPEIDQPMEPDVDANAEDASRAEIRRRMTRIQAGDVEWIDEDEVLAELQGDTPYDPAWAAELNRRIDEIEAGTATTVAEDEFFSRLSARRNSRLGP